MSILSIKTSENSFLEVAETIPCLAMEVKKVDPLLNCAERLDQKNIQLFDKIKSILEDRPNYSETIVYKILELESVSTEADVLLITNSYNMRLSNTTIQEIVKLLN